MHFTVQNKLHRILQGNPAVGHLRLFFGAFGTLLAGQLAQVAGQVDATRLAGCAGAAEVVGQGVPAGGSQVGLLGELALCGVQRVLTVDVEQAGGHLPEVHAHRVPVLVEHQQFVVFVENRYGHGTGHLHDIAGECGVFVQLVFLDHGFDDVSAVFDGPGANRTFGGFVDNMLVFAHISILEGSFRNSLALLPVTRRTPMG